MPPKRQQSLKPQPCRFPAARIKKIMQLDEEVGKLAASTPVMVSKSLECFLQHLVGETVKETQRRGSRKLTASHLKQTINTHQTLDFLRPLVVSIPDPVESAGPSRAGAGAGTGGGGARKAPAGGTGAKRRKTAGGEAGMPPGVGDGDGEGQGADRGERDLAPPSPAGLPSVGTWRRDAVGGGGSGEGGRGMFDDYEEDEDDY